MTILAAIVALLAVVAVVAIADDSAKSPPGPPLTSAPPLRPILTLRTLAQIEEDEQRLALAEAEREFEAEERAYAREQEQTEEKTGGEEVEYPKPADPRRPSAAVVAQWPRRWCRVQPGMTRSDVYRIMGAPTGEFEDRAGWFSGPWGFAAFFDAEDRARQLDVNDFNLSEREKRRIECESSRLVSATGE